LIPNKLLAFWIVSMPARSFSFTHIFYTFFPPGGRAGTESVLLDSICDRITVGPGKRVRKGGLSLGESH